MRSMTSLFGLLIALFCLSSTASGRAIGNWKAYTRFDGLAGGDIRSMTEDSEGNLWIATDGDGVSRYDGDSFRNFTKENTDNGLAGNFLYQILRDKKGNLWFATRGYGVCKYNGKDFEKTHTTSDGLANDFVLSIHEDEKGNLWFGTEDGISKYDGEEFENFTIGLSNEGISAILEDATGNIWVGTTGGRICNLENHSGVFESRHQVSGRVTSIVEDLSGNLWFGTWKGLYHYDGKNFLPFPLGSQDPITDLVTSILEDRQGNLWFATQRGIKKYDGNSIESFTASDGLVNNDVTAIVEDRESRLWFGTWGGGICQYDDRIQHYALSDKKITSAIEDHNGNLWFTTEGAGIFRYSQQTSQGSGNPDHFTTEDSIIDNEVSRAIEDGKGNLWFGGVGGITRYNGKTFEPIRSAEFPSAAQVIPLLTDKESNLWLDIRENGYTVKLAKYNDKGSLQIFPVEISTDRRNRQIKSAVEAALEDSAGNTWFGTEYGGIYRYNGIALEHFESAETAGLDSNRVSSIVEDAEGNVWFGLRGNDRPEYNVERGGGLSIYDGKTFRSLSTADGLSEDSVTSILKDEDNNLWFGTWHGGVSKYDGEKFENYSADDGLASNTIRYILLEKNRGHLWFGTQSGGVSQYNGKNFQTLTTENGLLSNWVEPIIEDKDGNIWFGYKESSPGSLTKYTPRETQPQVQISQIVADDIYENTDEVRTSSNVHVVIFHYRGLTISQLNSTKYIFRLEGYDEEWHTTKDRQVKYENLGTGEYEFTVRAIDRDLNYSSPKSIRLIIVSPWYHHMLYVIPLGLIGLVFLTTFILVSWRYSSHREETRKLNLRMLEQEQQAREDLQLKNTQLQEAKEAAEEANRAKSDFLSKMSHEIRTPLGTILGYAYILQRNHDLQYEIRNALGKIENSGRDLLKLINNILDISKIETHRMELQNVEFDLMTLIDGLSWDFLFRCEKKKLAWRLVWQKEVSEEASDELTHDVIHRAVVVNPNELPPRLPVYGDEVKLRQVLFNLLSNAVKFTESGEVVLRITFSMKRPLQELENQAADDIQGAMRHTSDTVLFTFEVIDTGVGISQEDRSVIFGLFQQGNRGKTEDGMGLGLNIARGNVDLMGGQLDFKSEQGRGSRFFFTVPLQPTTSEVFHPSADQEGRIARLAAGYEITALVVDDIPENREVLIQMLSDIGTQVMSAENGNQALDCIRSQRPDIVFMDIHMSPMNGIEAAQRIWAEFGKESVRIVAVSASAFAHERAEYLSTGFDAFLARPFLAEEIYECLANVLHVEYEYEDIEPSPISSIDLSGFVLPADLLLRLKEAAEFYSVTELKSCLKEIKEFSEAGQRLAEYLYPFLQTYDMKGILNILSQVQQK